MKDALLTHARTLMGALCAVTLLTGCPAVYPELATSMHKITGEQALDPPPPPDMHWVRFVSARVPPRTRDGRTWGQAFGSLPDPYAKLLLNGQEILKTSPQSDTLSPTWPDAPRGNFQITPQDKLRVEMWDSEAVTDRPIGVKDFRANEDTVLGGQIFLDLPGGGEIVIAFEPAHAMFGMGMWYELRTDSCFVTRMLEGSPAQRAGVQAGDEVLQIRGKEVKTMSGDEVRSQFGSIPLDGLPVVLRHPDGSTLQATLKEGPIYPPFSQFGNVD
jgi:hypothetical protein